MRIGFQNGYYGTLHYDGKKKADVFTPCGRKVTLNCIMQSIESDDYIFELTYDYGTAKKTYYITRGELEDKASCKTFANVGMDVRQKKLDIFAESIYVQESDYLSQMQTPNYCYKYLGWFNTTLFSADGSPQWCYRASKIITPVNATMGKYLGKFKITPMGNIDEWTTMVKNEVLPNIPMSIVLLTALSSVIVPLLSTKYPIGNGILHLCAVSNSGKSTAGFLATSISGEPFTVVRSELDKNNRIVENMSLLQSFSATENALLGKLSGINGVPMVLDELGKYRGRDLQGLIFDLFDGNSKSRMSKDLTTSELPGFRGTIITMGETSILEKCSAKLEGLYNRVFEMRSKLTTSAENSKAIKKICMKHNGRVAPRFANYIMHNGGVDMISAIYEKWLETLDNKLPKVKFVDKFIENFPAIYLTTAEIAKDALGLDFDTDAIVQYFVDYLSNEDNSMDISSKSYDFLIQEFASNSKHFYQIPNCNDIETSGEIWGRYYNVKKGKQNEFGKKIVGKYAVRRNILDELLKKKSYSFDQCMSSWKALDVIDYEDDSHPYRKLKIDVTKEKREHVYVFYIFDDGDANNNRTINDNISLLDDDTDVKAKEEMKPNHAKSSQLLQLLDPTDDCEDS